MSDVVSFKGAPFGQKEVNSICVDVLQDLLRRAEAGELVGIALGALHYNSETSWHVAGHVGGYAMIGALEMAKADLIDVNRGDV